MRILVCVKQVPAFSEAEIEKESFCLKRGECMGINEFDLYALEAAARIKDENQDVHITAVSMGPLSAMSVLRDSYALCADECCLITDENMKGSDVRKTAHILKRAIDMLEKENGTFDAIFCGAKTTDGGTSMLPVYLGQLMERPVVSYALSCHMINTDSLTAELIMENDAGNQLFKVITPFFASYTKNADDVRYPMIERIITASSMDMRIIRADELLEDEELPSCKTLVNNCYYRELHKSSLIIQEKDEREGAKKLARKLFDAKVL